MSSEYAKQRLLELASEPGAKRPRKTGWRRVAYPPDAKAKLCSRCGVLKPLKAFSKLIRGALGRHPRCKACRQLDSREYYLEKRNAMAPRPRPSRCECCGSEGSTRRALHFDHDHATGVFRGWLCHHCNVILGSCRDDPDHLRKLIAYLEKHSRTS